ncbi:MAG: NmrA family transcriptional regulator [Pseudomonadota bacterium]|nr:NmrA family transcriptional regulator [Pseudomonadota bacterium]
MLQTDQNKPVVLVGGNGKTGHRVAQRLRGVGIHTRAVSRSTDPAFDWADRGTWANALAGAGAAWVAYQPDLAVPQAAGDIATLARIARDAGVRRMVLLSGRGEAGAQAAEEALAASGIDWAVVRCAWFMQNFTESFLADMVAGGTVALPVGDVREPFVDVDDIADLGAGLLAGTIPAGRVYELTGPELLGFADAVAMAGAASGVDARYVPVTPDEFRAGLRAAGIDADTVELLSELMAVTLDGHNARTSDDFRAATGRAPRSFADFVRGTREVAHV